jgi:hypothetical protein
LQRSGDVWSQRKNGAKGGEQDEIKKRANKIKKLSARFHFKPHVLWTANITNLLSWQCFFD